MLQINVDISILMCLPTDSTLICTADRRVAIITAYHSSCGGISDIIRLLVRHSVTEYYLLDTAWCIPQIGSLCCREIYQVLLRGGGGNVCVFDKVRSNLGSLLFVNVLLHAIKIGDHSK